MNRHSLPIRLLLPLAATSVLLSAACEENNDPMGPSEEQTFTQVDRFGLPAINTVFIPTAQKQDFNRSVPSGDRAQFRDEVLATLSAFGVVGAAAEGLANAVLPDIQPIDTSIPTAFLNGRKPSDDVITGELMLIFGANADLNDDHVDANDKPFLSSFPYLAEPH